MKGNYIQEDPASVATPFGMVRPFDKLRDRRLTNRAQGSGSRRRKFRDFPNPQFVEPVETNPDVTPAFAPHPRPFDR